MAPAAAPPRPAETTAAGRDDGRHGTQRRVHTWLDEHDRWNAHVRGEGPRQRAGRAYGEILQEIRVVQTGVQILFAFLLTLAFTARFRSITPTQRDMYVLTLMLCAAATAGRPNDPPHRAPPPAPPGGQVYPACLGKGRRTDGRPHGTRLTARATEPDETRRHRKGSP